MAFFKNKEEYNRYLCEKQEARQRKLGAPQAQPVEHSSSVDREIQGLHIPIIEWCNKQWPRVKYIHARTDIPSGITVGCQDFTLFLPGGRVLCIECKRGDGKMSADQLAWKKEMEMLGHAVYVIRSMAEFYELVK